ncbi:MAG: carboxypeptidase regulatory-like domain-containing protein [Pyrinomonadaceae bacterium]
MSKIMRLSFLLIFVVASAVAALGQSTVSGAIGGSVTNQNKEVVVGAAINARNSETNKEDAATTDDQGRFRITNLQPGLYAVTINASGFGPYSQEGVVVEVGRVTELTPVLSVGAVSGTVEVTSEAPVINTTQQDFSSNINQTSINELPINGRRWSNFALLTPGAVPDGTFGLISFRGISGLLNNNTIDGGDNNQAFFAEERGRTRISYSISQAAIREFQVNTSSYSAEYGRSAGGVVNAVTKSGTNEFHGQVFYYQRNNKWGARNPRSFITQNVGGVFTPVAFKPEDVRHQFGGAIGGPIVKNKLFFFFSYDQQKRNFPGVATFSALDFLNRVDRCLLTAPAGAARTLAQCPAFPGTTGSINRNGSLGTGKGLTDAQVDTALGFLQSLSGAVPRRGDQKLFLPKIDWHINDSNIFTATYNRLRWESPAGIQTQAINTRARDNFGDDGVEIDSLNLRLVSTFQPALVNELRVQVARDNEFQFSQPPLPGEPTTAVGGRSPQTFITNGFSFGIPEFLDRVAFPDERRVQFADTVTVTAGNHTLKWGGDVNRVKDEINNLRFIGGEFNYTGGINSPGFNGGLNDFVIDYVNFLSALPATSPCYSSSRVRGRCYAGNFNQGLGVLGLTMYTTDYNLFFQDDWRASPRLTLNLGMRYEYQKNPNPTKINPVLPQTRQKVDDRNNFGPRVGFAYDVNGDGKTSLRGGWGLYYGRVINSTVYNALVNTGVGADIGQRQVGILASNAAAPAYPNLLTTASLVAPAVQFFSPSFQLPQIHQVDVVAERELARNTVASISYLFSFGNSLPNFVDTNLNPPSSFQDFTAVGGPFDGQKWRIPLFTGSRPNTSFAQLTDIRSDVWSKYHALVLQLNRRLTNGLQFQANYTLSRASDNGQSSVTFTSNNLPFNAFDQRAENSLSAFDRRQKMVISAVYNTDFFKDSDNTVGKAILNGWTIAPIFNAFSGQRFTATVSGTVSPGGSGTSVPPGAGSNFGLAPGTTTPGGGVNGSGGATRFALVPRNFFKQPNIWYLDLRLSRRFGITEGTKLELLAEAFNLFNRTQVTSVNSSIYSICSTGTAANPCPQLNFNSGASGFGSVTGADSTLFRERQVQLAVRFEF